jgi:hypothetical protein
MSRKLLIWQVLHITIVVAKKAGDAAGDVYRNVYGVYVEPTGYTPNLNVWGVDQNKWQ